MKKTLFRQLLLASLLFGTYCSAHSQDSIVLDRIVAIVGTSMIKYSDIENQYQQQLNEGFLANEDSKCAILEEMLVQKMLIDQAQIDSIEVEKDEVDNEIEKRIKILSEEIGSEERLEKFYNKSILELKTEWRSLVKDQILAQRMQSKILGETSVSPNEIRKFYNRIPKDSLPYVNPQYEYATISINPPITLEQKQEIRKKLEALRQRALDGEKFSKLAALYSDDVQSAKKGGELGYVSRADLVTEFAATAFKLKPGEISRIVETEYGFHIIELVDKRGEKINCRHILLMPRVNSENLALAKKKIDSVNHILHTDTLEFRELATLYSDDELTKNNSGLAFNPFTGSSKFEAKQIEPTVFHYLKELEPGATSEPFLTQNNNGKQVYTMVQLISKSPAHNATLTGDYQLIKEMALEEKKNTAFDQWIVDKQKKTYIKIDNQYDGCTYKYTGWK